MIRAMLVSGVALYSVIEALVDSPFGEEKLDNDVSCHSLPDSERRRKALDLVSVVPCNARGSYAVVTQFRPGWSLGLMNNLVAKGKILITIRGHGRKRGEAI